MNVDWEALTRAFGLSLAAGFLVGATGYFVMRPHADWNRKRPVLLMGVTGLVLLILVLGYSLWPALVPVPTLSGLSQAQAEDLLRSIHLVPDPRPQYASGVSIGYVVPQSQDLQPGTYVRRGTVLSFGVTVSSSSPPTGTSPSSDRRVALFDPRTGSSVLCVRGPDGLYRFSVKGTSSGVTQEFTLLLWVRPIQPAAQTFGWYLQRPPGNGVSAIQPDGSWVGVCQLGNETFPPQAGNTIDLSVSIASRTVATGLLARPGVVVEIQPIGVASDTVSSVVIRLK